MSSLTLILEKKLVLSLYWYYIKKNELCTLKNNSYNKGSAKDITEIILYKPKNVTLHLIQNIGKKYVGGGT